MGAVSQDAHKVRTCVWENVKGQLLQYCRSHTGFKALYRRILLPRSTKEI